MSAPIVRKQPVGIGLRGCKAQHLTDANKKKRLLRVVDQWAKILWSDDLTLRSYVSKKIGSNNSLIYSFILQLFGQPGAQFVRRRHKEVYNPDCVILTIKFGGGSIMVWGCMSASGAGELYLCEGRRSLLRNVTGGFGTVSIKII